jgi:septal ring factor EnvC (AmiA/AmiB activator)
MGLWHSSEANRLHAEILKARHAQRGQRLDFINQGLHLIEADFKTEPKKNSGFCLPLTFNERLFMSEEILIQETQAATPADRLTAIQGALAGIDERIRGFTQKVETAKADIQRIDADLAALRERRQDTLASGEDPKTIDREITQAEKERLNQTDLIAGCERALDKLKAERLPVAADVVKVQSEVDALDFIALVEKFNDTIKSAAQMLQRIVTVEPKFKTYAPVQRIFTPDLSGNIETIWARQ